MSTSGHFQMSSRAANSAGELFGWFERPGAFERLTPPWSGIEVVRRRGTIHDGDLAELRINVGPLRIPWIAVHSGFVRNRRFVDTQTRGPFSRWIHTHGFGESGVMEDTVDYRLRGGPLSKVGAPIIARTLDRQFSYRHRVVAADLKRHRRASKPQRIVVAGGTGLLGCALVPFLQTGGHDVVVLTRRPSAPHERAWNPDRGRLDPAVIDGADVIIHLAGESISSHRWSAAQRSRILDSRTVSTRLLVKTLEMLDRAPRVLVCASAIGIYGDCGDATVNEDSRPGGGFLSDVCSAWEAASRTNATRVIQARLGVVLSPHGGALRRVLLPANLGLSGPAGNGRQWSSWITIDDALYALHHLALVAAVEGPVNVVSPNPVSNRAFAATLGRVLRRPAFLPLPRAAVHLVMGEMGERLLFDSARVLPRRLEAAGYNFAYPRLEGGLRHVLGA